MEEKKRERGAPSRVSSRAKKVNHYRARRADPETPFALGYSMPAEWARHESTWLSWPKNPLTFPAAILPKVEAAYVQMIEALARGERVDLLVDDEVTEDRVRSMTTAKNVSFHRIRSADVWIRDYGPIFVRKEEEKGKEKGGKTAMTEHRGGSEGASIAATKWRFNAWGGKYDDLLVDDETGMEVARRAGLRTFETGVILEGGSIDVNGKGLFLTTEQCLLNENRNPQLGRAALEGLLHDYLGAESVVWLEKGVAGDDTDGHVDDLARFVDEGTVVCMSEQDEGDVNHSSLKRNQTILSQFRDTEGHRLEVVTIAMPREVTGEGEEEQGRESDGRLPASYANFYVANSAVLVPVFGDARRDGSAIDTIADLFPRREVVPVACRELVYGFGGIHCVTQQQPASG